MSLRDFLYSKRPLEFRIISADICGSLIGYRYTSLLFRNTPIQTFASQTKCCLTCKHILREEKKRAEEFAIQFFVVLLLGSARVTFKIETSCAFEMLLMWRYAFAELVSNRYMYMSDLIRQNRARYLTTKMRNGYAKCFLLCGLDFSSQQA